MPRRVAIQGYKGCFHEQAARLFYASPCHSEQSEDTAAKSAAEIARSGEKAAL